MGRSLTKINQTSPRLVADLTYPSTHQASGNFINITGIDASAGLTTVLSLTGKYVISFLRFTGMISESNRVKLTIDDVVIWDDTYVMAAGGTTPGETLLGMLNNNTSVDGISESFECNRSFLLELDTLTDTNVSLQYLARPIL